MPQKVSDSELKAARLALSEATRRFLERCRREGLLDDPGFHKACEESGIALDPADLARLNR